MSASLADAWPEGVARHVLTETDSTNAEARRLAATLKGPAWILARRQTAGRGRRGRGWLAGEGNFTATLLIRPAVPQTQVALYSFVAALALYEALAGVLGRTEALALKWPNDVLLAGGKVSGILLEAISGAAGIERLAIGIGVNLASAPEPEAVEPGAVRPVSLQGESGIVVDPEAFLDLLAPAFARWQALFDAGGFTAIREPWLARAARLGEKVTARVGAERVEGVFEGIDTTGALILATAQGRRDIPAADVYF